MSDEKKKPEEEATPQGEQKSDQAQAETKPTEPPKEEPKAEDKEKAPEEKPTEENSEGEKPEEKAEGEGEQKTEETAEQEAPPELSEVDKIKEENFRLKTQLEAMKVGFNPNVIEDAVVLAENIVKRDGSDIATALKAVAKKYPEWKADSEGKKGGIKVGADTSKQTNANSDKLNRAFGIKK